MAFSSFYSIAHAKEHVTPRAKTTLQVLSGCLLLNIAAQISIPVPFTSVPLTLQTFAVLFLGAALGSKKAALSVSAYLLEACLGLPVLAGGLSLPSLLAAPRAGYLAGMFFQAYIFGSVIERAKSYSFFKIFFGGLAACAFQMTLGALWLSLFVGIKPAFILGFYPFILSEVLKVTTIAALLRTQWQKI